MTLRKSAPHRTQRWMALAVVTIAATLLVVGGVLANLPGSPFDGADGNLVLNDETQDWVNAPNRQTGTDLPTGQQDDSFGQGTKEDTAVPTVIDGSIPNNKSDLIRFYVANQNVGGAEFLYLAWERVQEPNGTTNMDFEFNKSSTTSGNGVTPVRTAGDLLIKYDLAQGGVNPSWATTFGSPAVTRRPSAKQATRCLAGTRSTVWPATSRVRSTLGQSRIRSRTLIRTCRPGPSARRPSI